eukprot:TRINITY_DN2969_c0_g1_i1.p1 TRINITY_DN2969_c0_g1~~TRINITY_DN2969_c0_g1_i1.p1  ORF type:complete len:215 (-),score=29.98 TRINITY_DN2969_c0_g1_i1:192-836(-)
MYAQEFPIRDDVPAGWYGADRTRLALGVRNAARSVVGVKAFVLGVEDKNQDGVLDQSELSQDHFNSLDRDGDGGIDTSEFLFSVNHVDPQPDPSQGNPGGWSMLHYAAAAGRLDVTKYLFSAGADIHLRDYDNKSALMVARKRGHSEVVQFLEKPDWTVRERFRIRMDATREVDMWRTRDSARVNIWHGSMGNFMPDISGYSLSAPTHGLRHYV